MLEMVLGAIAFLLIPTLTHLFMSDRYRAAWLPRATRTVTREGLGVGAFRRGDAERHDVRWSRGGMPVGLRIAALSCVFSGQMLIPGLLAALVGLGIAAEQHNPGIVLPVLVAAAVPGAVVAVMVWRAGLAMFGYDYTEAARRAQIALFATWALNVLLLAFAIAAVSTNAPDHPFAEVTLFYAPVSMIHTAFVRAMVARHCAAFASEQPESPAFDPAPTSPVAA